jgi:mono/diheme cytochrome c family protein
MKRWVAVAIGLTVVAAAAAGERPREGSPARGERFLATRPVNSALWSRASYDTLWKVWGLSEKPADFDRAVRDRYGLHPDPRPGRDLPLGLQETRGLLGTRALTTDCLLCHAGSVAGQSFVGLGNASLDMQLLYEDLAQANGRPRATPFTFSNVRGTTEAGAMAVYLFDFRNPDLSLRPRAHLPYRTDLCEDTPAWWLLKKKRTMYHTGSNDARSVRSLMQFALSPLNSPEAIKRLEPDFVDLQSYILSLEPPKYPFPIDEPLAAKGKLLFGQHCAHCHGTYGPGGSYPNKIIPLEEIGTDPTRATGFSPDVKVTYDSSWFGQELGPDGRPLQTVYNRGYQAPPLDGVWATAPYFHNGSVPTLRGVLNSKARPKLYTRSYRTGREEFDPLAVGWKVQELAAPPAAPVPPAERRSVYDTTQPGRGNGGHTFGDDLTEEDRAALIEYLKTL